MRKKPLTVDEDRFVSLLSPNPSVVGEHGTEAIEKNPQGNQDEESAGDETQEEEEKKRGRRGKSGPAVPYEAAQLPTATSQEQYLNEMYDARLSRERKTLEDAYEANVAALDQSALSIPGRYQAAANQTAGQAAVQRAAFQEQAAAGGLNSGARGQASLAMNNALLGSLSGIRQAQTAAMDEIESQRNALRREYQQKIAEAVAANETDRAEALYAEAKRVDESIVATAIRQADENYKEWKSRYG